MKFDNACLMHGNSPGARTYQRLLLTTALAGMFTILPAIAQDAASSSAEEETQLVQSGADGEAEADGKS